MLWGNNDDHTAQLLTERLSHHPAEPVMVFFEDEDVARLWSGHPGVDARAWAPTLVRDLLVELPPRPVERVAPPPIVVGDSTVAGRLVQGIASGWGDATERVTIHCLGSDDTWAKEAALRVGHAEVTWLTVPLRAASVVEAVTSLVAQWPAPRPKRGTRTGPTVYVAASLEGQGLAVASAVAEAVPDARVAVVLSGDIAWPPPPGVRVVTVAEVRARLAEQGEDPHARLARLWFDDAAWLSAPDASATAPGMPLFPEIRFGAEGRARWQEQDEALRGRFIEASAATPAILRAGGITLHRETPVTTEQVVSSPSELAGMADTLLGVLGVVPTPAARLTALECVARLPVLAVRAGFSLRRLPDEKPLLTPELVELLAPQVHATYMGVSVATENASQSPIASELWSGLSEFEKANNRAVVVGCAVAHAAEGLAWRRSSADGGVDLTPRLKRLGELEHRRWAIHERRNGRGDHQWAIPWDDLDEEVQRYDVMIMGALPGMLADAGLEIYEVQGPSMT